MRQKRQVPRTFCNYSFTLLIRCVYSRECGTRGLFQDRRTVQEESTETEFAVIQLLAERKV